MKGTQGYSMCERGRSIQGQSRSGRLEGAKKEEKEQTVSNIIKLCHHNFSVPGGDPSPGLKSWAGILDRSIIPCGGSEMYS